MAEAQGVRAAPRIEASFRVAYRSADDLLVAYSSDLCKGGLFLQADAPLPVGTVVRVGLMLEGGAELAVVSRVAYVRDEAAARALGKPAGMGLEFLDMSPDSLASIEKFIADQLGQSTVEPAKAVRRLKVVVVDDDEACRALAATPFRARGDEVRLARDGFEALAMCLKETPDVILSDVHMPRMDGWQLLRLCRARPTLAGVPFVFMTTLDGEASRLRGYQMGVDDYIAKPFRVKELQSRVDRLVARAPKAAPVEAPKKTLRGDLSQVALPSVLSFLELERRSGELLLDGPRTARLFMREGRLVRLEIEGEAQVAAPERTLRQVLNWRLGQFEFAAGEVAGETQFEGSVTGLLLEHARLSDEEQR